MPRRHTTTCLTAIAALAIAPLAIAAPWLLPAAAAGYTVKAACSAPARGHAACLGLRLVPSPGSAPASTPGARPLGARGGAPSPASSGGAAPATSSPGAAGLSPAQLHTAYGLPSESTEAQTIAIVDAYDDPNAEADLGVFDQHYGLPPCTHENGCFTKVNQQGLSAPLPPANGEWSIEISTDVQVAHSLCENCHIVLVEATSDTFLNLDAAENAAAALLQAASAPGAPSGEISNSWGGEEPPLDSPAFNHPGIVITASSGDSGYLNWGEYNSRFEEGSGWFEGPSYPASSPRVVAVGGTSLSFSKPSGAWLGETVWNNEHGAGGGGCSRNFAAPLWQPHAAGWSAVGCGSQRAVADISADADPATGVHAYDSVPEGLGTKEEATNHTVLEWITIGGTSVASPIVASAFALAGGAHGVPYPAATLYANAGSAGLHDVLSGGNGACNGVYNPSCSAAFTPALDCGEGHTICNAVSGYDGPTGVGTPLGLAVFQPVPGEIGGPGSGSGAGAGEGGAGAGGGPGTGGQGGSASPGGGSSTGTPPPPPSKSKSGATSQLRILGLSLTLGAIVALNRHRPQLSKVAFRFVLSASATVRVTLARRVRIHGHWRWATFPGSNSFNAHAGANSAHLGGRGALPSGRYRLTLTPAHGIASSIAISIG
jgi:hypothetical protein